MTLFSQTSLPIGTILPYVGNLANIPSGWHLCDGTNGTPDLSDRFLEGTKTAPKTFKDAGLPNIQAKIKFGADGDSSLSNQSYADKNSYGLFYYNTAERFRDGGRLSQINLDANQWVPLSFDASRSNPIYGNSETVQPKSYTVYYIMRVK